METVQRGTMEKEQRKKLGKMLCVAGLLVLTLNILDYFAGWNALADETAIAGITLALSGALLALA